MDLVSAFATTSRLVLGQEATEIKSDELSAVPVLLDRLAEGDGLNSAVVSIDALASNAAIAQTIKDHDGAYLLVVKANPPTLRTEREASRLRYGRIERRAVSVIQEVDWLDGERRFPGELRPPHAATLIRVRSRAELSDRSRFETRHSVSSAKLAGEQAAEAVHSHRGTENQPHWTLDIVSADDKSRMRKGCGARNMAVARHFASNFIRPAHSLKDSRP